MEEKEMEELTVEKKVEMVTDDKVRQNLFFSFFFLPPPAFHLSVSVLQSGWSYEQVAV